MLKFSFQKGKSYLSEVGLMAKVANRVGDRLQFLVTDKRGRIKPTYCWTSIEHDGTAEYATLPKELLGDMVLASDIWI